MDKVFWGKWGILLFFSWGFPLVCYVVGFPFGLPTDERGEYILNWVCAALMFQKALVPLFVRLCTMFIFFIYYPLWRVCGLASRRIRYGLWRISQQLREALC